MRVSIKCPSCAVRLKVEQRKLGKRLKCPGCGNSIVLKAEAPSDVAPPALKAPTAPKQRPTKPKTILRPDEPTMPAQADENAETYGIVRTAPELEPLAPQLPPRRPKATSSASSTFAPASSSTPARRPKSSSATRPTRKPKPAAEASTSGGRSVLYIALLATMIPLVFSLFGESDVAERFERSFIENGEQIGNLDEFESVDDLLGVLPDQRLVGAHLSRQTWVHWIYAALSLSVFIGFYMRLFRNIESGSKLMLSSSLFTATVGIFLLLAFQWLAAVSGGMRIIPRGIIGLVFLLVKLIGYSYSAALDPSNGFIASMLGFTFGVGLCEEVCKAIPVVFFLQDSRNATWRTTCLVGLASGVGFGVSEGITYSADYYNGIMGLDIYIVRFISCVALHSTWAGGAAVLMYFNQSYLPGEAEDLSDVFLGIVIYLGVAIVLHGLYDTLLKQEYNLGALITAVVTIGWFIFIIERIHDEE